MTEGTIETYREELIDTAMMELIVWIPLSCLILAFVTTFLIKSRQPFHKRYPKGFLMTLTMLYSFYIFLTFIKLIAAAF